MVGGELGVGWQCCLCGTVFGTEKAVIEHFRSGVDGKKLINVLVVDRLAVGERGERFSVHRMKAVASDRPRPSIPRLALVED